MNEQRDGHSGRSHSFGQGNWSGGSYDSGGRVPVSLACSECKTRNYKTTKAPSAGALELKKFCKQCKKHTVHRETK